VIIPFQQLLLCATQSLFLCDAANGQQKASPTSQQSASGPAVGGGAGPTGAGATGTAATGGGSSVLPLDCKANPPSFVFIQGWQMLALAVSLFLPRNSRLLWFLRLHLARNAESK
jgi:pleckstrin homology domain-containing family H